MAFKNIIFAVALSVLCGNGVTAASADEITRANLHQAISEARHRSLTGKQQAGRDLNFEQCISDTQQLYDDSPSLTLAGDKVDQETDEEQDRLCGENDSDNTCIVDENDMESSSRFRQACREAGGRVFEYNHQWECTVTSNQTSTTTYQWLTLNMDFCAHPACNRNDVLARLEQNDDTILDNVATELSSSTNQVECDANLNLASAAVSFSYFVNFMTGVVAATVAFFI